MSDDNSEDRPGASGATPDLTVRWIVTDAPGSAERHLKLLKMLFGPTDATAEHS